MEEKSLWQEFYELLKAKNKMAEFLCGLMIMACIFMCFVPCLIPLVVMCPLMLGGDKYFQKRWNLPEEYAKNTVTGKPYSFHGAVSVGWLFLTGFEAAAAFFIILFHMIDMGTLMPLWVSLGIYAVLSFIILRRKYNKIQKWKMAGMASVVYDETESDPCSSLPCDAKPWQEDFSLREEEKPWQTEESLDWDGTEEDGFDEEEPPYTDEDSFAEEKDEDPADPEACPGIPLEELKKLKELLDMEIITREEFEAKKKQMLGL